MHDLGNEDFLRVVAMATKRAHKCLASAENINTWLLPNTGRETVIDPDIRSTCSL